MRLGDRVRKPKGYRFNGVVRSVFTISTDDTRVVVEMDGDGSGVAAGVGDSGLLHIFNEEQLTKIT